MKQLCGHRRSDLFVTSGLLTTLLQSTTFCQTVGLPYSSSMDKKPDARAGLMPNDSLFDVWSLVHLAVGICLGWLMAPLVALILMAAHEPFEVKVLSPWLARHGIVYGYEALRNSLSDIFFDAVGIAIGYWLITSLKTPPFHLF